MSQEQTSEARPLLIFLNEVAGGRKLIKAVEERSGQVSSVVVAAPQNHPAAGQIVDTAHLRDAARARVEVTMSVLAEYGIDSVGEVMDPDPSLAPRRRRPRPRPGRAAALLPRRDPVRVHPQGPGRVGTEPVRARGHRHPHPGPDPGRLDPLGCEPHARRRDPDRRRARPRQAAEGARGGPSAPLHDHLPAGRGRRRRPVVAQDLASTLAELYRADIDATGQPMSPDPFLAVRERDQALPRSTRF